MRWDRVFLGLPLSLFFPITGPLEKEFTRRRGGEARVLSRKGARSITHVLCAIYRKSEGWCCRLSTLKVGQEVYYPWTPFGRSPSATSLRRFFSEGEAVGTSGEYVGRSEKEGECQKTSSFTSPFTSVLLTTAVLDTAVSRRLGAVFASSTSATHVVRTRFYEGRNVTSISVSL